MPTPPPPPLPLQRQSHSKTAVVATLLKLLHKYQHRGEEVARLQRLLARTVERKRADGEQLLREKSVGARAASTSMVEASMMRMAEEEEEGAWEGDAAHSFATADGLGSNGGLAANNINDGSRSNSSFMQRPQHHQQHSSRASSFHTTSVRSRRFGSDEPPAESIASILNDTRSKTRARSLVREASLAAVRGGGRSGGSGEQRRPMAADDGLAATGRYINELLSPIAPDRSGPATNRGLAKDTPTERGSVAATRRPSSAAATRGAGLRAAAAPTVPQPQPQMNALTARAIRKAIGGGSHSAASTITAAGGARTRLQPAAPSSYSASAAASPSASLSRPGKAPARAASSAARGSPAPVDPTAAASFAPSNRRHIV